MDESCLHLLEKASVSSLEPIVKLTLNQIDYLVPSDQWNQLVTSNLSDVQNDNLNQLFKCLKKLIKYYMNKDDDDYDTFGQQLISSKCDKNLLNSIEKIVTTNQEVLSNCLPTASMASLVNSRCQLNAGDDEHGAICTLQLDVNSSCQSDSDKIDTITLNLDEIVIDDMVKGMSKIMQHLFSAATKDNE